MRRVLLLLSSYLMIQCSFAQSEGGELSVGLLPSFTANSTKPKLGIGLDITSTHIFTVRSAIMLTGGIVLFKDDQFLYYAPGSSEQRANATTTNPVYLKGAYQFRIQDGKYFIYAGFGYMSMKVNDYAGRFNGLLSHIGAGVRAFEQNTIPLNLGLELNSSGMLKNKKAGVSGYDYDWFSLRCAIVIP